MREPTQTKYTPGRKIIEKGKCTCESKKITNIQKQQEVTVK